MRYLALLTTVALLPACAGQVEGGDASATAGAAVLAERAASATSVVFTTSTGIPENPPPDVDVTVTDVTKVRALFAATLALPIPPAGTYNCPDDFGVTYQLSFTGGGATTNIELDATGCGSVTIPGAPGAWTATSVGYWSQLADTLGVPEATLYPYSPPGG